MVFDLAFKMSSIVIFWQKETPPIGVMTKKKKLGNLLKPRSDEYFGYDKATFTDKLSLLLSNIQGTQRSSTSDSTPSQKKVHLTNISLLNKPLFG